MTSLPQDTIVGVLSGLIIAGLAWICTGIVLPWVRNLLYQGFQLEGHWVNEFKENGNAYRFESEISQRAKKLRGKTVISKQGPGEIYRTEMKLIGRINEGFVSLILESKSPTCLSIASAVMKIEGRGARLVGWLAYRTSINDEAAVEKAVWQKLP
jgi:hypothetical protein